MVLLWTGSLKVAVTVEPKATPVAPAAGVVPVTVAGVQRIAGRQTIRQRSGQGDVACLAERGDDRPPCPDELPGAGPEHDRLGRPAASVVSRGRDVSVLEPGLAV